MPSWALPCPLVPRPSAGACFLISANAPQGAVLHSSTAKRTATLNILALRGPEGWPRSSSKAPMRPRLEQVRFSSFPARFTLDLDPRRGRGLNETGRPENHQPTILAVSPITNQHPSKGAAAPASSASAAAVPVSNRGSDCHVALGDLGAILTIAVASQRQPAAVPPRWPEIAAPRNVQGPAPGRALTTTSRLTESARAPCLRCPPKASRATEDFLATDWTAKAAPTPR